MISKVGRILRHPAFKRLSGLNQHGLDAIVDRELRYTRADHSIAVADIVEMHGGTTEDVTYAITHDIAHGAFSHSMDRVLAIMGKTKVDATTVKGKVSHHDLARDAYLLNVGLEEFRTQGKIPPMFTDDVNPDNIEYTLHAGVVYGDLTLARYHEIIKHISFDKTRSIWVFEDVDNAVTFANLSEKYTHTKWPANAAREVKFCYDIAHSVQTKHIDMSDLFYGTDMDVYHRVKHSPEYPQTLTLYGRNRARTPYARLEGGKVGATTSRRTYVGEPKESVDQSGAILGLAFLLPILAGMIWPDLQTDILMGIVILFVIIFSLCLFLV